jgi:hypothetical protein
VNPLLSINILFRVANVPSVSQSVPL